MNVKLLLRLEQICSGLQSEGWIFIGRSMTYPDGTFYVKYRHPNGARMSVDCFANDILLFRNKKLVKREHVG